VRLPVQFERRKLQETLAGWHLINFVCHISEVIPWGWVKTLVPSEPQNSWDLWMFIPLKMVFS
jgi:hypothetical protein